MRRSPEAILLGTAISLVPAIAVAHVAISSGPGYANTTQIIKFGVGHGCVGTDLAYYELSIRARVGDNAFSTVYFPARHICRGPDGGTGMTDWTATDPDATTHPT